MQMNLQLHHVVSDITGATGMKIIRAIINGQHDPNVLIKYRDIRCKESIETITKSLIGNYQEEHVFALRQAIELYDYYASKVEECEQRIEITLNLLDKKVEKPEKPLPKAKHRTKQPNDLNFDVRATLYQLLNIDLTQIHGIGPSLVLRIDVYRADWLTSSHDILGFRSKQIPCPN